MKTLIEAVQEAVQAKADGYIKAIRANDGFKETVALVWDDSSENELMEEAEKKSNKLTGCAYQWTIAGYVFVAE